MSRVSGPASDTLRTRSTRSASRATSARLRPSGGDVQRSMRSAAGLLRTIRSYASSSSTLSPMCSKIAATSARSCSSLAQRAPQPGVGDVQAVQQRRDLGWHLAHQVVQALLADLFFFDRPHQAADRSDEAFAGDLDGDARQRHADVRHHRRDRDVGLPGGHRDEGQAGQQHHQRGGADQDDRYPRQPARHRRMVPSGLHCTPRAVWSTC